MKKVLIFFSLLLTAALFLSGCNEETKQTNKKETEKTISADKTLTVYTTVYPLQFFTKKIGGDFVNVETIYPPGSDEHTFEPSQKDMIKLAEADLFFYIGLGLEGFVDNAKKTLKNEKVTMVATGEMLHLNETNENDHADEEKHEDEHGHEDDHGHTHGDIDPHVWLDPVYALELAEAIKNELIHKMPEEKSTFENNFEELSNELKEIDQDFKNTITNAKQKNIIVSHAAYGYWEKRYGLHQISISGLSTTSEPSQKQLETIIETAKEYQIKYILFEQNVNSHLTEIVQKEVGAEPLTLHNLGVLTDDDIKNKDDYITLMRENISTLQKALN
ncbi:zinc ABC transporter substrate-binding protein [Bacillus aquiflavi]|uniref:Zinc ABC transporter substrate-binding protein n=1 Tax=Bacillus aquiflavi TaxID=2672567 RepID=A0A6B3VWP3_9BACI|nr:zinc ABC transporter substrate-binding protein [Bacillus aquiflavi]MBA4537413.1 zinc ABC transporter substrate-binding protein [Bacillus aquiflavi]NEY81668.1 zinc ABC transporter substrate-binding protein [Bacillus aquiflavi]